MRQFTTVLTLALVTATALAGCGSEVHNTPPVASPTASTPGSSPNPDVDLSREVVAHGMLMQRTSTTPVELCIGPVLDSYPPQCGGPTIAGEFAWNGLSPERSQGITWTQDSVWAVGRFDPGAGTAGTFTLTQPIRRTPPAGMHQPTPERDFPQLCDDPFADGGSTSVRGPEGDTNALMALLPTLDGYAASWVSDGSSLFNVLVTSDAAAAHREIRKVWKGGLCVVQRDVATEADITAAQEALGRQGKDLGLLSDGDSKGSLEVEATLVDAATRARILAIVEPWLTPEQVRITSSIQPLPH